MPGEKDCGGSCRLLSTGCCALWLAATSAGGGDMALLSMYGGGNGVVSCAWGSCSVAGGTPAPELGCEGIRVAGGGAPADLGCEAVRVVGVPISELGSESLTSAPELPGWQATTACWLAICCRILLSGKGPARPDGERPVASLWKAGLGVSHFFLSSFKWSTRASRKAELAYMQTHSCIGINIETHDVLAFGLHAETDPWCHRC